MTREIELSNLRAALAEISEDVVPIASLTLPASKMDQEAVGTTRSHACWCPPGAPRADCPVHALADQLVVLRTLFPDKFVEGRPSLDLPLFPAASGSTTSKQAMANTILQAASYLEVPAQAPDGSSRVSGHSLRPTGAQGLTRLGLDIWAVQLIGRWGSTTVQAYVRDAAVSADAAVSRARFLSRSLQDLASERGEFSAQLPAAFEHLRAQLFKELSAEVARRSARSPRSPSTSSASSSTSSSSAASEAHGPVGVVDVPPKPAENPEVLVRAPRSAPVGEVSSTRCVKGPRQPTRHRVLTGPESSLDPGRWVTYCGWWYGRAGTARPASATDTQCRKCWPSA